jgi:hypothetical protein
MNVSLARSAMAVAALTLFGYSRRPVPAPPRAWFAQRPRDM